MFTFIYIHKQQICVYYFDSKMEGRLRPKFLLQRIIDFDIYTFTYDTQDKLLKLTIEQLIQKLISNFSMCQRQVNELYFKNICKKSSLDIDRLIQFLTYSNLYQVFKLKGHVMTIANTSISLPLKRRLIQKQKNIELTKCQKYALVAFKTIMFISKLHSDEHFFQTNIDQSIRQRLIKYLSQWQAEDQKFDQAKEKIKRLFKTSSIVNKQKWHESVLTNIRFVRSAINEEEIIFNPTFLTSQIFKTIISNYSADQFLIGFGGLGKSLSQWLLTCLSRYVQQFKINREDKQDNYIYSYKRIHYFLQDEELRGLFLFPKIYYVTLSQASNCMEHVIKAIQLQTPFQFQSQKTINNMIQQIYHYYQQKDMRVTFIVDQINVYTSQIRRKIEDKSYDGNIKPITQFLNKLKAKGNQIIYSSSINCQLKLVRDKLKFSIHRFLDNKSNILKIKLGNSAQHHKRDKRDAYIEILHSILFQIEIRLTAIQNKKLFQTYRTQFALYFQYLQNPENMRNQLCITQTTRQITPLAIYDYFSRHTQFRITTEYDKQKIAQQFLLLQEQIKNETRNKLSALYTQFILKGTQQVKMLKYILYTKIAAFALSIKNFNQSSFVFSFDQTQKLPINEFDIVNKQHSFVNYDNKTIQIFYSPFVFLQITKNISQPYYSNDKLFKNYWNQLTKSQVLFGYLLDKQFTYLISHRQISLKLDQQILEVKGQNDYFINFNPGCSKTLASGLSKVIQKLQKKSSAYIGVYPAKILKDTKLTVSYAYNSQVIDALIIKKMQNHQVFRFKLLTLDFSVTTNPTSIHNKYTDSKLFFEQLERNDNNKRYYFQQFQIVHYIVAPEKGIKNLRQKVQLDKKNLLKNLKIILTPLQTFEINIKEQSSSDKFYIQQLQFIKNLLKARQENE